MHIVWRTTTFYLGFSWNFYLWNGYQLAPRPFNLLDSVCLSGTDSFFTFSMWSVILITKVQEDAHVGKADQIILRAAKRAPGQISEVLNWKNHGGKLRGQIVCVVNRAAFWRCSGLKKYLGVWTVCKLCCGPSGSELFHGVLFSDVRCPYYIA